jgi:hypothetical protein
MVATLTLALSFGADAYRAGPGRHGRALKRERGMGGLFETAAASGEAALQSAAIQSAPLQGAARRIADGRKNVT